MQLLRSINGHGRALLRAVGRRYYAAQTEEYLKRNYAANVAEYNTVMSSLNAQRRYALLRDAYDDMMLDGVQPTRDTFHSLIAGTMKGARMEDAFFFRDEMKTMGLLPDLALYNYLISTCGKCKNSEQAVRILEEMKRNEVKPTGQTYVCLLNACAATGSLDRVLAIVRDMTAAGLGLNKFCYAGLIAAHKNRKPLADDTATKIIELVEQSKGWSEATGNMPENVMMGVSLEELYNIPTAEYVHRRGGFVDRRLTVYHVASHALADLRDVEKMETLLKMLQSDNYQPDVFITIQAMRCYLHAGDLDRGHKLFEDIVNSGRPAFIELYVVGVLINNYMGAYMSVRWGKAGIINPCVLPVMSIVEIVGIDTDNWVVEWRQLTLAEGAMVGYSPRGMQLAQDTLVNMTARNFFLNRKMGTDLLLVAAGEKTGGYTVANYVWDLMQARNIVPFLPAVEAYYNGLREREIPADDPRLLKVGQVLDNLKPRLGR